jgi:NAD(P)-dependent dehydrogenase (short-subunit alcohol dehydrogenase family)
VKPHFENSNGSLRGIGRGIVERLGRGGASVVVNYAGSEQEAKEVVEAIAENLWIVSSYLGNCP